MLKNRTLLAIAIFLFVGVFGVSSTLGQGGGEISPRYYDNNEAAAGIGSGGAAGVWDIETSNWNVDGTGASGSLGLGSWVNGSSLQAIFGGTGDVVRVVRTSVLSESVQVQASGYKFRFSDTSDRSFVGDWLLGTSGNAAVNVAFDGRLADNSTVSDGRSITIGNVRNRNLTAGSTVTLETFSTGSNVFRVNIANNGTFAVPLTITGTGAANLVGTSAAIISGNVTGNGSTLHLGATTGNSLTVNGTVNNGAGNVQFGVGGTGGGGGTVIVGSGTKTWANTIINLGSGVVRLNAVNALPTGTNVIFDGNSTLELNGRNTTIAALTSGAANGNVRNQSATAALLTINGSGSTAFAGGLSDGVGGGALSIARSGSGTTTLSGINTYTGSTTVSGGTLVIDGTHTGGGATTVSGGELIVNGSLAATTFSVSAPGTVSGSGSITTANLNVNGTISPGSSIGSMAVNGNLNLNAGSTFEYELRTNGLNGDLIHVAGNLNITNGALLTVTDLNVNVPVLFGSKLTMISYTGAWNGGLLTLGATQLANNDIFMVSGQEWRIRYNDTAGGANFALDQAGANGFLTLTAVPEPSAFLFVASALGLGFVRRRRS
ncbi:MAG: autotransporter-associated beta strand repeat-containing protein [Pirellulaceae bacterium]|nr:autotransporter-associated beta strand repeat-containing protein [Pirellulaceae bacterium]